MKYIWPILGFLCIPFAVCLCTLVYIVEVVKHRLNPLGYIGMFFSELSEMIWQMAGKSQEHKEEIIIFLSISVFVSLLIISPIVTVIATAVILLALPTPPEK